MVLEVGADIAHWSSCTTDARKVFQSERSAVVMGRVSELCGIHCGPQRRPKSINCMQDSTCEHVLQETETCLATCVGSGSATFDCASVYSVELERVGDDEGATRQVCELERENGWCGRRQLVENAKPIRPPRDRDKKIDLVTRCRDGVFKLAGHVARQSYDSPHARALCCQSLQWWR